MLITTTSAGRAEDRSADISPGHRAGSPNRWPDSHARRLRRTVDAEIRVRPGWGSHPAGAGGGCRTARDTRPRPVLARAICCGAGRLEVAGRAPSATVAVRLRL